MGTTNFQPPPLINHQKIVTSDYLSESYSSTKFGAYLSMGDFWPNRLNITILFIYTLFFGNWQVKPVGGFLHLMAQTTRTWQGCAFCGFHWYYCTFSGQIHPKPRFLGHE